MHVRVNDAHDHRHRQDRAKMRAGGWDRVDVAGAELRPGRNNVVFSGHGSLRVDPSPRPGAGGAASSQRSYDGGQTFHAGAATTAGRAVTLHGHLLSLFDSSI